MLAVTCAYAAVAVPDALYRLRTDVLAAATYSTNWWLIASKQSYFEALGRPPLLRHLWSLAVEEQWYLLWPLVFVLAMGLVRGRTERLVVPIVLAALASTVWMAIVFDPSGDASRAYFGTDTRASGLLIGAAAAMVWTPWRWPWADRRRLAGLDAIGWLALLSLVAVMLQWGQTTSLLYRGGFLLVSVLSIVVVAVSVHPGATTFRAALSLAPLRWLGSRSYGLYLWHWPVFMVTRQQDYPDMDGRTRFALRLGLTFALTELSFRLVERPVRDGSAMQWITDWRADRARRSRARGWAAVGATAALLSVGLRRRPRRDRRSGRRHDRRFGGGLPTCDRGALPAGAGRRRGRGRRRRSRPERARARPSPAPCRPTCPGGSSSSATRRPAPWSRTRRPGLGRTLALANGAVEGCGLFDHGTIRTTADFRRSFGNCQGWPDKWAASARRSKADIALVVIGAWDVFDLAQDSGVLAFGSPAHDAYLLAQLQRGISGLVAAGSQVALLEVPCYDPVDGGGLTALPGAGRSPADRPPEPPPAPHGQQRPRPRDVRPRALASGAGITPSPPISPIAGTASTTTGPAPSWSSRPSLQPSSPSRRRPAEPRRGSPPGGLRRRLPIGNLWPWPTSPSSSTKTSSRSRSGSTTSPRPSCGPRRTSGTSGRSSPGPS